MGARDFSHAGLGMGRGGESSIWTSWEEADIEPQYCTPPATIDISPLTIDDCDWLRHAFEHCACPSF